MKLGEGIWRAKQCYAFASPRSIGSVAPGNFSDSLSEGAGVLSFKPAGRGEWAVRRPPLSFPCVVCEGRAHLFTFGRSWEVSFKKVTFGEARQLTTVADLAAGDSRRILAGRGGSLMVTAFQKTNACYKVYVAFPAASAAWPPTVPELLIVAYTADGRAATIRAVWPRQATAREHCYIYTNTFRGQRLGQPKILWQAGNIHYRRASELLAPEALRAQMRAACGMPSHSAEPAGEPRPSPSQDAN